MFSKDFLCKALMYWKKMLLVFFRLTCNDVTLDRCGFFFPLLIRLASFEQNSSTQRLVSPASINIPRFLVLHLTWHKNKWKCSSVYPVLFHIALATASWNRKRHSDFSSWQKWYAEKASQWQPKRNRTLQKACMLTPESKAKESRFKPHPFLAPAVTRHQT